MDLPARSVRLASWPSQFEGLFIGNSNFSILDLAPNNGSLAVKQLLQVQQYYTSYRRCIFSQG